MKSTIDKVTIAARGLSDEARANLEREAALFAQARLDEEAERDAVTMEGVAEFERGAFVSSEEWSRRVEAHLAELKARRPA